MGIFYRALALVLACWLFCLPAVAAQSPRRSVECRVFSKLYASLHEGVKSLDQAGIAQQLMFRLESDIGALNLEDPQLQEIQRQYVADFHEMGLVFKNIREGQLVGDDRVVERMLPYFQTTNDSINANTKQLNTYCQKVWGFKPIGVEK